MDNMLTQLNENTLCLKNDELFFRNKMHSGMNKQNVKCLLRMAKQNPDKNGNRCESELLDYDESMYCLTHQSINAGGWVLTRNIWIRSSKNLVHVYEYLCEYKPMPTWEKFVEFVKECTTVKF